MQFPCQVSDRWSCRVSHETQLISMRQARDMNSGHARTQSQLLQLRRHLRCPSEAVPVRTSASLVGRGALKRPAPWMGGARAHDGRTGWAARPRTAARLAGRRAPGRRAGSLDGVPPRGAQLKLVGRPQWGWKPCWARGPRVARSLVMWSARARRPDWLSGAAPWSGQPSGAGCPCLVDSLSGRRAPAQLAPSLGEAPALSGQTGWEACPRAAGSPIWLGARV